MKVATIALLWCLAASHGDDFTTGNNIFTADIFNEILNENPNSNILISPISTEIVLALLQAGAKGATGEEIRSALQLPKTDADIKASIQELLPNLASNENFVLSTANKIFVQESSPVTDFFKNVATQDYKGSIENLDFSNVETAVNQINQWVSQNTQNKIQEMVTTDSLSPLTSLLLINALHFKGKWQTPFSNSSTTKDTFFVAPDQEIQVDTMHLNREKLNYFESSELDAHFLELPFTGNKISLVIALPKNKFGFEQLENNLKEVFTEHDFSQELVNLALPKFKLEDSLNLGNFLKKLGMSKAFEPNEADFSGITGVQGNLYVSEVLQKTFMEVDEKGAEVAAATFGSATFYSGAAFDTPPIDFIVDHPFLFYLKFENLVLFAGKIVNPQF